MHTGSSDGHVGAAQQDSDVRQGSKAVYYKSLETALSEESVRIVARAAIAEFGTAAAALMQARSDLHKFNGEHEGGEFWQRVAAAVRTL